MRKLQSQGVHHITIVGADRQTSIDFWEGVLGMPFIFEQPNLDNEGESHLYFDPGDGRLITVFTERGAHARSDPDADRPGLRAPSRVRGLAGHVRARPSSGSTSAGSSHSGVKDRGFMDSIYFTDPLGLLIELASYRFEPPAGFTHADVLFEAHKLRVERGDHHIDRDAPRGRDRGAGRARARRCPTTAHPRGRTTERRTTWPQTRSASCRRR